MGPLVSLPGREAGSVHTLILLVTYLLVSNYSTKRLICHEAFYDYGVLC